MRNQDMLEMAAKAGGFTGFWVDSGLNMGSNAEPWIWNPLVDDGDALRLAMELGMTIRLEDPAAVIVGWAENQHVPFTRDGKGPWFWKEWGRVLAPHATARRAIVRAAAELQRLGAQ